ncbi:hypothetical protein LX36DRAFT_357511 [Colletotrichum falcatum]|nr:hypothetical protein LX36DRAFT_357511 [Colletotrichum falcatum]
MASLTCSRLAGFPIASILRILHSVLSTYPSLTCFLPACAGKSKMNRNRGAEWDRRKKGGGTLERDGASNQSPGILAGKPPYQAHCGQVYQSTVAVPSHLWPWEFFAMARGTRPGSPHTTHSPAGIQCTE